jgi:predicted RNA-binding protein
MCQATVYMVKDDQREEIMREVIHMTPVEQGVRLRTFFEEPRIVTGRVTEIDFLKHTVTLVPLEAQREPS